MFTETIKNQPYVTRNEHQDYTTLTFDTRHVTFMGIEWQYLSSYGKRKLENLFVLQHSYERLKFIYL